MGPALTPIHAIETYINMTRIRSCVLNMSSILPVITTVGMAERKPVMKRPTTRAPSEGTAAMTRQNTLYRDALKM